MINLTTKSRDTPPERLTLNANHSWQKPFAAALIMPTLLLVQLLQVNYNFNLLLIKLPEFRVSVGETQVVCASVQVEPWSIS